MTQVPKGREPAPTAWPDVAEEAALIERVRAGDISAFETIFRAYYESLYRFSFRYLRCSDEADEAVQGVFARIWRHRSGWHVGGTLRDYLFVATRNASRDCFKHAAVTRRQRDGNNPDQRPSPFDTTDADRQLQTAEIEAAIERSLALLPAKRREICALRISRQLSYAEIANRLNISPKTVETQIARGLKFLREQLRQFLD